MRGEVTGETDENVFTLVRGARGGTVKYLFASKVEVPSTVGPRCATDYIVLGF